MKPVRQVIGINWEKFAEKIASGKVHITEVTYLEEEMLYHYVSAGSCSELCPPNEWNCVRINDTNDCECTKKNDKTVTVVCTGCGGGY